MSILLKSQFCTVNDSTVVELQQLRLFFYGKSQFITVTYSTVVEFQQTSMAVLF